MDFPQQDFWDWTLPTYARDGVAEACLDLQQRHGVDVNVVLYAVWVASLGVELTDAEMRAAKGRVDDWHALVVRGLRSIRTALKGDPHGAPPELAERFRTAVKQLEVESERMEHVMLAADAPADEHIASVADRRRMAERSVHRYLDALGARPDDADASNIRVIATAGIDEGLPPR